MSVEIKNPILVVGLGGAGSKIATKSSQLLDSDCLLISNDKSDFTGDNHSIEISNETLVNPSVQSIRGFAAKSSEEIEKKISGYETVILMANLAGKAGAALAPIVSGICKASSKTLVSFAIMPFKYEKDRIFNSGISLKRLRIDSNCTIVLDNDALLESNPDLTAKNCFEIANTAIFHVVNSLKSSEIADELNVVSPSRQDEDIETALKNSLKVLYGTAPPNAVKKTMLHVLGGNNVPIGMLNTITNITSGIFNKESTQVEMSTTSSEESGVVMVSSVQGETKFDSYDPLGMISEENTLDWDEPDCSINCKLDLPQLE